MNNVGGTDKNVRGTLRRPLPEVPVQQRMAAGSSEQLNLIGNIPPSSSSLTKPILRLATPRNQIATYSAGAMKKNAANANNQNDPWRTLSLIVYNSIGSNNSTGSNVHWAFWIPASKNSTIGTLIHIQSDVTGVNRLEFSRDFNYEKLSSPKSIKLIGRTRSQNLKLGGLFEQTVIEVPTSHSYLQPATSTPGQVQDSQVWVHEVVKKCREKGMLGDEAITNLNNALRN